MLAEEALLAAPLGHSMSLPPPSHQQLPPSLPSGLNKTRTELHDIPTKIGKPLDDASAYPLDYQRYHTLMYAHCAQQQHVGQMSAFRPWAPPKSFLHAYNAAAVAALCLSQEPPILQNPERVVRNTDRERFERTYQPNVALAPRKNITPKEMDRERERERERERIEREREREIERARERERSREREKEREREIQQLQQHTQRHEGFSNDVQVHIKQERANTPCNMSPVSPPLPSMQVISQMNEQHLNPHHRRNIATMSNDDETQPLSLSLYHHKRHIHAPPPPPPQQQHPLALKSNNNNGAVEMLQQRRSSLQNSSSSTCSTSSSVSSVSPPECHPQQQQQQQQLLGLYHTFHQQQQQSQQHQQQIFQPRQSPHSISPTILCKTNNNNNNNNHHYSPQQHQQNNHLTHSPEELSSSNEITSSTSPLPVIATTENVEEKLQLQPQQQQYTTNQHHQYETQTIINTVNQHAKLLPTTVTSNTNNNNNNNNNNKQYDEMNNSRIRINKNLMHTTNIMRTPTPPTTTTTKTSKSPVAIQQQQQQYDYNKKQTAYVNFTQPQQQQQQPPTLAAGLNLSTNKKHSYLSKFQHNGTRSHYNHAHMGSGEFELSTDTDDESVNGEPDSSINVLPPWEVAVEALRETKPKERERVLHLLQRLLHDNHQYRCANLKLNELLQKRETQIRELSEQVHHYRFLMDQRQQQQQQQQTQQTQQQGHLKEQDEPENLKNRIVDEKLCVPLKKSLRREPDLLLLDRKSPPRINNLIEAKRKIKEETIINDNEFVERKKTKTVDVVKASTELEIKIEEIEELDKLDSILEDSKNINDNNVEDDDDDDYNEHSPEISAKDKDISKIQADLKVDNEVESDTKSNQSTQAKDGILAIGLDDDNDNEIQNNVDKQAVQNKEISLCTNDNAAEETDGSDNMDDEDDEDVVMDDIEPIKKELDVESNMVEKLTDVNAEKSKDEQNVANKNCRLLTTNLTSDESICKKSDKSEKRSKEMTYILAKKKKKKKERKERKEKRRAAAAYALAAAAAASKEVVTTPQTFDDMPHNGMRPPMVTKASKKQTPMTTNCDLQPQQHQQQQTIKQE